MPFFKRFWNVLRGKGHALLDRIEDPEEQLSVFVSELSSQVQDLQRSVASAIADEKRLQKQVESLRSKSTEWEERAVSALDAGDEGLARQALGKQEECDSEAAALESGWRAQQEATDRLKESLKLARTRMEEARRKYNLLLAQYKSAETKKKLQDSLSATSSDSPMQMMEQLEERIRGVEAEAEAQLALSAENVDVDVEARFQALDRRRRGDEALARLKAKLEERRQLGSGDDSDTARIEDLKARLDG
jgi:phage shock protein A